MNQNRPILLSRRRHPPIDQQAKIIVVESLQLKAEKKREKKTAHYVLKRFSQNLQGGYRSIQVKFPQNIPDTPKEADIYLD